MYLIKKPITNGSSHFNTARQLAEQKDFDDDKVRVDSDYSCHKNDSSKRKRINGHSSDVHGFQLVEQKKV